MGKNLKWEILRELTHRNLSTGGTLKGERIVLAAAVLATGMAGTAMAAEKDIVEKGASLLLTISARPTTGPISPSARTPKSLSAEGPRSPCFPLMKKRILLCGMA